LRDRVVFFEGVEDVRRGRGGGRGGRGGVDLVERGGGEELEVRGGLGEEGEEVGGGFVGAVVAPRAPEDVEERQAVRSRCQYLHEGRERGKTHLGITGKIANGHVSGLRTMHRTAADL
jgi:hypothetical protein